MCVMILQIKTQEMEKTEKLGTYNIHTDIPCYKTKLDILLQSFQSPHLSVSLLSTLRAWHILAHNCRVLNPSSHGKHITLPTDPESAHYDMRFPYAFTKAPHLREPTLSRSIQHHLPSKKTSLH